jgi:hypothetical protein
MLNEQLLKDGFAYLRTIPPNVKYVKNFRKTVSLSDRQGFGAAKGSRTESFAEGTGC